MQFQEVWEVASAITVLFALAAVGYVAWKRGIIDVQAATIKAYEDRIKSLESTVSEMQEDRVRDRSELSRLSGVVEGKERAMTDFAKAVAEAGICANAFDCHNRKLPVPAVSA